MKCIIKYEKNMNDNNCFHREYEEYLPCIKLNTNVARLYKNL